jgi:hypothetical protein
MQRHTGYPCKGTQGIYAEAHRVSMQAQGILVAAHI